MPEATAKPNAPSRSLHDHWEAELGVCRDFPIQLEVPLSASPMGWLHSQSDPFQLLWANRGEQDPIVAAGSAMHIAGQPGESADSMIQRCREVLAGNAGLRFYGGFPFGGSHPLRSPEWQPFGTAQFWLPRWVFDGKRLRLTVLSRADIPAALQAVTGLRSAEPFRHGPVRGGGKERTCPIVSSGVPMSRRPWDCSAMRFWKKSSSRGVRHFGSRPPSARWDWQIGCRSALPPVTGFVYGWIRKRPSWEPLPSDSSDVGGRRWRAKWLPELDGGGRHPQKTKPWTQNCEKQCERATRA